jgi:hypothetical protein
MLAHLAVVVDIQWRAMGGAKANEDGGEIALIQFSGMCYNCNQSDKAEAMATGASKTIMAMARRPLCAISATR